MKLEQADTHVVDVKRQEMSAQQRVDEPVSHKLIQTNSRRRLCAGDGQASLSLTRYRGFVAGRWGFPVNRQDYGLGGD